MLKIIRRCLSFLSRSADGYIIAFSKACEPARRKSKTSIFPSTVHVFNDSFWVYFFIDLAGVAVEPTDTNRSPRITFYLE